METKTNHRYSLCKKCGKKGVYTRTLSEHTKVEYCKYCAPRTGTPRAVAKLGILARLRKLLAV
jgi:hypothetical protein